MADYYPLLARALEALPDRSPPLRNAVYHRARGALIGQLRSLDPPVSDADIDVERKALDAAIERLEADYGAPAAPKDAEPAETPSAAEPSPPSPSPPPSALPLPEPAMPPALAFAAPPSATAEPATKPDPIPFVPPPRKAKPDAVEAPPPVAEPVAAPAPPADPANGRKRPKLDVVPPKTGRSRLLRNVFVGGVLTLVIGLIAVAAFVLRDRPADLPQGPEAEQTNPAEPADSKFSDRVGGERLEAERRAPAAKPSAAQPDITVAQRATLYEENIADPKAAPAATQGRVSWRLETVGGEQGQPLRNAVRANVEFPDAGFALAMTIRKNLDATLPASHTIELAFTNSGSGENRVVQDVGLLQLKDEESGRGSPVSGLPVRVRDNLFLIGLSNLPNDIERNTDLLLKKNWLDLAVKFRSGQRAVLTFDKGTTGAQVMQSAFDEWRE